MSIYITLDGGTTNTRLTLVAEGEIKDTIKISLGARSGIDDKDALKCEIKKALAELLERNRLSENDVKGILASGMITSEFGLCNLPHINTPAGIKELHESMHETTISEITDIPFVFIRGVKKSSSDFSETDIMRGEETEVFGIADSDYGKCVYVLPGSHSKIMKVDKDGKITDFVTMLTGEMIASLSGHTILKDAVDLSVDEFDSSYLLKGYEFALEEGINKALFKVRILKNVFSKTKEEVYSFFLGIILADEISEIIKSEADSVVLGGRAQIKEAMAEILRNKDTKKIITLTEEEVSSSTAFGAIKIYEADV